MSIVKRLGGSGAANVRHLFGLCKDFGRKVWKYTIFYWKNHTFLHKFIISHAKSRVRGQVLEPSMSASPVLAVAPSVVRLAGMGARRMRRTRTSDSVAGFMLQRLSRLLEM